jgi:dTDP-4-amino-4,6-dideoxygalactose transaminase
MKLARTLSPSAAAVGILDVAVSAMDALRPAAARARITEQLKTLLDVEHLFLVSSGKAALTLSFQALTKIRLGNRVLIPAYTCYSVPAAVIRAGLEPVLFDVDPRTLDFDEASLRRGLGQPGVIGVVPTHLFGVPSDVAHVNALAGERGVLVVEDAAQAFGLSDGQGRKLGTLGDLGVFSFARGKHLTAGSGGMMVTRSPEIAAACDALCGALPAAATAQSLKILAALAVMSVFATPWLYWLPAGLPFLKLGETSYDPDFALSNLPATAVGALHRWRSRLERANQQRQLVVDGWRREAGFPDMPGRRGPLLRFPVVLSSTERRNRLLEQTRNAGLGVSTMYPNPVHLVPELAAHFNGQRFPGAEALAARLITLPTHAYVRTSDRARFAGIWRDAIAPEAAVDARAVNAC